jgi:hypothetical protein
MGRRRRALRRDDTVQMRPATAAEQTPASQIRLVAGAHTIAGLQRHPTGRALRHATIGAAGEQIGNASVQRAVIQRKGNSTLRYGSTGGPVKKLQQRLNAAGAEPPLKVDGIFGPKTQAAVKAFQSSHVDATGTQLVDDGVVGKLTWGAIEAGAAAPDIEAADDAMGEHIVAGMDQVNVGPHGPDIGVHYDFNYKASYPDRWNDDYAQGYADPTYFERIGQWDWVLKPGMSASAAIKSWLRGLTIAECNSAIVAIQIDTLRAAIGDARFDALYGSTDKAPEKQLLRVKQNPDGTPVADLERPTDAAKANTPGTIGNRPAKPGEWYYFYNHPQYRLKHPGGAFQGENSLFVGAEGGVQIWSGMGEQRKTELELMEDMRQSYNAARDEWDLKALEQIKAANGDVLPPEYDPASKIFPDQLASVDEILSAPASTVEGVTRKGGFVVDAGTTLDADKVAALRAP